MNTLRKSLQKFLLLAIVAGVSLSAQVAHATDYYISPSGKSTNSGTISAPWDIVSGLQKTSVVKPGDTIWLRGGTYGTGGKLVYTVSVKGSSSAPVTIRQYKGEHAKVNAALRISGAYVWVWGFEVTNTSTTRNVTDINADRPRGILICTACTGVKVINMEIHDVGRAGVGGGTNTFEVYGSLFWGNGIYDSTGTIRGDATYLNLWQATPDPAAVNLVRDNIAFRNLYSGFKVYTEWSDVYVEGYDLEGNISFDNGMRTNGHAQGNLVVRGQGAAHGLRRIKAIGNYTYRTPDSTNPYSAEIGCAQGSGIQCQDVVVQGNYFVTGASNLGAMRIDNWQNLQVSGNTAVGNGSTTVATYVREFTPTSKSWDGDQYYRGKSSPFMVTSTSYSFPNWQSSATNDKTGTYSSSKPTGVKVAVRKNIYEPGQRANIVIYNWPLQSSVTVDLTAAGLADGSTYEIMDAQNFYGAPVAKGTYYASSPTVSIPMNLTAVTPLVGSVTNITNKNTAPEFGAFVLRKTN